MFGVLLVKQVKLLKMKIRINNTKIILTTFFCLLSSLFVKAADETVTMKVGTTKTLYLPSYVTSKAIHGSQWTSTRPDEIAVVSQTSYSVTIKAKKSVPSSTTCLVHCQYYYLQAVGTFTYMATGIYDFKILTESIKPVSISLPSSVTLDVGKSKYLTPIIVPENVETKLEWSSSQYSIINVFQDGWILAQRQGTSVITVKTSNGLYASCTVTAVKPNVDVTSIKVSPASYTIDVGERYSKCAI